MKNYIATVFLVLMLHEGSHAQWQKLNLPSAAKVNTVAISDSGIIAGTDGDGIFVSTDNGENWVARNDGLQSMVVHTILTNGSTIFAGTEAGVSISTNNGFNWETTDSVLSGESVWSLAARNLAANDSIIFAGAWSGVYRSTNNGKSWETTSLNNTTMPVQSLVVRNHDVFAATLLGGVFHSQSDGFSWDAISIVDTEWDGSKYISPVYSLAIIDSNVVAGAGPGYFYYAPLADLVFNVDRSVQRGNNPIFCIAYHDGGFYAGSSTGNIFSSNFDGSNWTSTSFPLTGHAIYSLALNDSCYFAGTESGIWRLGNSETGIHPHEAAPAGFLLGQNYPNPFNPTTKIEYQIAKFGFVSLKVYDVLGRPVATLVDGRQTAGNHSVKFDAGHLPSGIYFYTLAANGSRITKKLILMK